MYISIPVLLIIIAVIVFWFENTLYTALALGILYWLWWLLFIVILFVVSLF